MRDFYLHPMTAAVFFTVLIMGALGCFVLVPVVCINWFWNAMVSPNTLLPTIQWWQASLLYSAFACFSYLMGWVRVEFKTETVD